MAAGPGGDPVPVAVNWPGRARRSLRPRLRGLESAQGDLVIGAFVLARLLGVRLLTLEARVIVHEADRDGPGPLVLAPVRADRPVSYPARSELSRRPGSMSAGSERLAHAVRLVEQGADTLKRTRRTQYRG